MKKNNSPRFRIYAVLLLFFAAVFLLPACRTGDAGMYLVAAAVPGVMLLLLAFPSVFFSPDRPSLSAALPLCGFGIMAAACASSGDALSQCLRCAASLLFLAAGAVLARTFRPSVPAAGLLAVCGLAVLCCPLWFPGASFSLAESGTALLLPAVAALLTTRNRLPALAAALGGMILLLLQQDAGSAAVWGLSLALLFWAASDSLLWSGISLVSAGALFWIFFRVLPPAAGSGVSSLLPRIASMPLFLPASVPESTAVASPDSLFFLLGEHYGLILLLCAVLLLVLILIRGASVAQHARKTFHAALVLGVMLHLGLRTLLFLCAAAGTVPVSPGSFPFLTSFLPDLFTHFFLLGLLSGVSARNEADLDEDVRLIMLAR